MIANKIIVKMRKAGKGTLFFTEDFISYGSAKTVSKTLERLVKEQKIYRVARGIYTRPEIDPMLGVLMPGTEDIARAIRRRDKSRMMPTGVLALNSLGLSTQVPMNIVYLTDGAARKITMGKRKILLKKTAPKNLSAIGKISRLVIQAMKVIGKDQITEKEIKIILKHLSNEDPYRLEHDIRLAPEWIRVIMRKALKPKLDD
jgi:hypothetical protein